MPVRSDSDDRELSAFLALAGDLAGQKVLEIGCGNGRLTWRYARQAAHVTAIDPDSEQIAVAIEQRPPELHDRITFRVADFIDYLVPERFDLAILSWSL